MSEASGPPPGFFDTATQILTGPGSDLADWKKPRRGGNGREADSGPSLPAIDALTPEQEVRVSLVCGAFAELEARARPFDPFVWLVRALTSGILCDAACRILSEVSGRWSEIGDPWAYAQTCLDREGLQVRIAEQLREHEALKRDPAVIGSVLADAARRQEVHPNGQQ